MALYAHRQIDAAAVKIVTGDQYIGKHDAGPDLEQFATRRRDPAVVDLALQLGGPLHGGDDAVELGQHAIAHGLEDLAAGAADGGRDQPIVDPLHEAQGLTFIALDEAGIAHNVQRYDRDQSTVGLCHMLGISAASVRSIAPRGGQENARASTPRMECAGILGQVIDRPETGRTVRRLAPRECQAGDGAASC